MGAWPPKSPYLAQVCSLNGVKPGVGYWHWRKQAWSAAWGAWGGCLVQDLQGWFLVLGNSHQERSQYGFWHRDFPPANLLSWGASLDPQAWFQGGRGGCCRVVQICGGTQVGFHSVLSTNVQTEGARMSVLGEQRVLRLGETSQQAHYRAERSQQNLEDKCRQVLR